LLTEHFCTVVVSREGRGWDEREGRGGKKKGKGGVRKGKREKWVFLTTCSLLTVKNLVAYELGQDMTKLV